MLFKVLKRQVERCTTVEELDALADKVDIFMAAGKISVDEYSELVSMIANKREELTPQGE